MLTGIEPAEPREDVSDAGTVQSRSSVDPASGSRGHFPRVRLRAFRGEALEYLEWKHEVIAMKALHGVTDDQLGGLVYLACEAGPGKPRDVLRHLERADVLKADGLKLVWQLLDEEYIREPYVRSDEALTRYNRCRRKPGQSMEEFLRELKLARRMLEKEDPGMRISDTSYAHHMLRKSGLNKLEQRQVLGAAQAQWDPRKLKTRCG